jgi:hypothetical protein
VPCSGHCAVAADTPVPTVVPPTAGRALAGLLTHLHRDHADADALRAALGPRAPVLEPPAGGGDETEELALLQAEHELAASGLERRRFAPWQSVTIANFTLTALPEADGLGDPQAAWLIEADGVAFSTWATRCSTGTGGVWRIATDRSTWSSSRSTGRSSASPTAARPAHFRQPWTRATLRPRPKSSAPGARSPPRRWLRDRRRLRARP